MQPICKAATSSCQVKEENIDPFMGKMAYESHENPAWYNLLTLITGWLPYTLLLLFSLFILPWKKFSKTRFLENAKSYSAAGVHSWLAFLLVLFFIVFAKSKRSVYLLPCYPFMAYLIAEYIVWMMKEKMGALKVYAGVIASITHLQYRPAGGKRMGARKHLPRQACHRQYRHAPCARKQRFAHPMQHLYGYHFGGSLPHLPGHQERRIQTILFHIPLPPSWGSS